MPRRTLIRDAECVLPDETRRASVLIEEGRIQDIDPAETARADETIEASGLLLLPGLIDEHVHFREPGATEKENLRTGSMAAAKGGVTTFFEMPNTSPPATTRAVVADKYARAARSSLVNYGFYIGATTSNVGELASITEAPGIKIFVGSSTGDLLVDDQEDLERIYAETTLPICVHAEDESTIRANRERMGEPSSHADHSKIRDREAAVIATKRVIDLARRHEHRTHILHVTTEAEVALIAESGGWVTGEACPHHLWFTEKDYERLGGLVQMNPPVKTIADREALWKGLVEGRLQTIGTDHAPHLLEEKRRAYPESPSGVPSVELTLPLLLTGVSQGRCSVRDIAEWMGAGPCRVWGIAGKGRIEPGYDADLALADPEKSFTVRNEDQVTRCGWSPWAGERLTGAVVRTIVGGQTVYHEGRFDESVRGAPATLLRPEPRAGG